MIGLIIGIAEDVNIALDTTRIKKEE